MNVGGLSLFSRAVQLTLRSRRQSMTRWADCCWWLFFKPHHRRIRFDLEKSLSLCKTLFSSHDDFDFHATTCCRICLTKDEFLLKLEGEPRLWKVRVLRANGNRPVPKIRLTHQHDACAVSNINLNRYLTIKPRIKKFVQCCSTLLF